MSLYTIQFVVSEFDLFQEALNWDSIKLDVDFLSLCHDQRLTLLFEMEEAMFSHSQSIKCILPVLE